MIHKFLNYLTVILFLIPFTLLIVDSNVLFPFITTKALVFRTLVTGGLILTLWLYLLSPVSFPKKNYLFWAIVLFFFVNILATIFSINSYRSFWGNAERMEGLWSLFFYLAYFFLLFTLFQFKPESRKTIFYSILIVTTAISLMEINQAFISKAERPSATLGNPTYIGFLNLLTIFLILYFLFEKLNLKNKEDISIKTFLKQFTQNIFFKLSLIVLIFINLLSLLASQTRGSILGLLAGIFTFTFFYFLFSKISFKNKILIFGLILIFLIGFYFFLKEAPLAFKIPGIKRIAETIQNPQSVFPRLFAWKIFFNAFKERPIFGWGPETMPITFFKNFEPKIYNYEQSIFDRPHNKFIEVLTSTGIIGFIAWLLIFIAFIYYLFKENINLLQKSSLFAFIVAYLAQNFSLFDMQASYLLFFFGLSLIVPKSEINFKERFIRPYLILILGLAFLILIINAKHFYVVRNIISILRQPDIEVAAQDYRRLSEIAGPFLSELSNVSTSYFQNNFIKIKNFETLNNFYEIAKVAYLKDQLNYKVVVDYLKFLEIFISFKKQAGINYQKEINEVIKVYKNLIAFYPKFPDIYVQYAEFLFRINENAEAKKILDKAEKIIDNQPNYYFIFATLYFNNNQKNLAYQNILEALNKGFQLKNDNHFQVVLEIFLANQDVENSKKIISLWLKQNNSSFIKEKITHILEKYNFQKIVTFDK